MTFEDNIKKLGIKLPKAADPVDLMSPQKLQIKFFIWSNIH